MKRITQIERPGNWTSMVCGILGLVGWVSGCGGASDGTDKALWKVAGCSSALSVQGQTPEECQSEGIVPNDAATDREILYWKYDAGSQSLTLVDANVGHTCCAQLTQNVTFEAGGVNILQLDAPPRCRCMCQSTLTTCLAQVALGSFPVVIQRDRTDDEVATKEVWHGNLDLSQGQGQIEIVEVVR